MCCALALLPAHASGQAAPPPSQVAPPDIRPSAPPPTRIVIPQAPAGAEIPPAARKLQFVLTGLTIEGEFDELVEARKQLAAPLIGKRITVADLFELAAKLQAAYARAGYPLARVVLLPQTLEGAASVRIRVIDGFVDRIDDSNLPPLVRDRVSAVVAPLINQRHLKQSELERRLLIAGDIPGLRLSSVFGPGKDIGGAVLVLTGLHRAVSASLYVDNSMPQSFRTTQGVLTLSTNSVLRRGEQFYVTAAGTPDSTFATSAATRRYLGAGFVMPLGYDGWKIELAYTNGRTTPSVNPSVATQGRFDQIRTRLSYDAVKSRDFELTLNGRLDATDERIDSLVFNPPVALSQDRVRPLRGGFDGIWYLREWGTTASFGATYSHGFDWIGARTAANASALLPLSRQGADAVFDKLEGRLEITQALPAGFVANVGAFMQTSFGKPLLTSEQFSPIGSRMLSGFTAGSLAGDTGWVTRAELGHPLALGPTVVTPYGFAATGERIYKMPTAVEIASVHATNVGAGLRAELPRWNDDAPDGLTFIEASNRQSNDPNLGGWRVFVGALLRY